MVLQQMRRALHAYKLRTEIKEIENKHTRERYKKTNSFINKVDELLIYGKNTTKLA